MLPPCEKRDDFKLDSPGIPKDGPLRGAQLFGSAETDYVCVALQESDNEENNFQDPKNENRINDMRENFKKNVVAVDSNSADEMLKRRAFLKYSGAAMATSVVVLSGCDDLGLTPDKKKDANARMSADGSIDLGSGDIGILNYAYALEQLEAAFYTMVVADAAFSTNFSVEEQTILTDLKQHEITHREFFKAALGDNAIPGLTPDFSKVNFSDRGNVLATAKTFEDLGVAAYNGAGKLISDVQYLLVAGKIVSDEARHASAIRDVINPLSTDFAGDDVVDANGLDVALMPMEVLAAAQTFIKEKIDGSHLPTR